MQSTLVFIIQYLILFHLTCAERNKLLILQKVVKKKIWEQFTENVSGEILAFLCFLSF